MSRKQQDFIGELSMEDLYAEIGAAAREDVKIRARTEDDDEEEADDEAGGATSAAAGRLHRSRSESVDIVGNSRKGCRRRLFKQKSWSTQASCEEAWERRRDQFLRDELKNMQERNVARRSIGRCSSADFGSSSSSASSTRRDDSSSARFSRRSLTDDDLEELRGCIDLGFGFDGSKELDARLCTTFPALELCHAISRNLQDCSSPSPLRSSGESTPIGSLSPSWKISSPGDHPQQVKTRLRHWAQAVACSVRQCC